MQTTKSTFSNHEISSLYTNMTTYIVGQPTAGGAAIVPNRILRITRFPGDVLILRVHHYLQNNVIND